MGAKTSPQMLLAIQMIINGSSAYAASKEAGVTQGAISHMKKAALASLAGQILMIYETQIGDGKKTQAERIAAMHHALTSIAAHDSGRDPVVIGDSGIVYSSGRSHVNTGENQ